MRILYVTYVTWKSIALANSFTVYEQILDATSRHVWCGARDVVYRSDIEDADYANYNVEFPAGAGRVAVPGEDEALALIINQAVILEPRTAGGNRIVAERNLLLGQAQFLRTDIGTAALNVDGGAGGTPVKIWDGESTYWTPAFQGSEEAAAKKNGTNGWDTSPTTVGQQTTFDGGDNQDMTAYDTLSFWMQPKAYPVGADLKVQWKASGGGTPGNQLLVENYVSDMDLDEWQLVTIPIADFGDISSVDKLQFYYASAGGQQFWFDDIEVNTSGGGGPFIFRVEPPDATVRYHLSMAVVMLAGPSAGWDNNAFANIAGGLANGLLLRQRRLSTAEVLWSINSKDNVDLFGRFHPQDDITFADDVLLMGFMIKPSKASIIITDDDVLEIVVRDDLDAITQARAFAHYGVEEVA
jgi:hypothetical protein